MNEKERQAHEAIIIQNKAIDQDNVLLRASLKESRDEVTSLNKRNKDAERIYGLLVDKFLDKIIEFKSGW